MYGLLGVFIYAEEHVILFGDENAQAPVCMSSYQPRKSTIQHSAVQYTQKNTRIENFLYDLVISISFFFFSVDFLFSISVFILVYFFIRFYWCTRLHAEHKCVRFLLECLTGEKKMERKKKKKN